MEISLKTKISYGALFVHGRRALSFFILLSVLISALDILIVNTVLPSILKDLDGIQWYGWAVGVYSLAAFITIPIFSSLVELWGPRSTLSLAVGFFLTGSLIAALAKSMLWIVAGRFFQGLGAGGFFSIPFVIIALHYPVELKPRAAGLVSAVWGATAVGGPLIGAGILHIANWHWVFWFNFPLGILVLGLSFLALKGRGTRPCTPTPLNILGPILFALSTACFLRALSAGWPQNILLALVALTLFILFILHEERSPRPIIPPEAWYLNKPLGSAFLGMAVITASFCGVEAFLPLLLQGLWGETPLSAGLILTVGSITWSGMSLVAAIYANHPRRLTTQGTLLLMLGLAILLFTLLNKGPVWLIYFGWGIAGCGIGLAVPNYNTVALDVADRYPSGTTTGALQLGLMWGVAVGPAAVGSAAQLGFVQGFDPQRIGLGPLTVSSFEALRSGGIIAQGLCIFLAMFGCLIAWKMPKRRLTHHHPL